MKITCGECNHEFEFEVSDELVGWETVCFSCGATIEFDGEITSTPCKMEIRKDEETAPTLMEIQPDLAKRQLLATIAVAGLLGIMLACQLFGMNQTQEARTKWEYSIEAPADYSLDSVLRTQGELGWELVTARRAVGSYKSAKYEMIFKRPRKSP